VSWRERLDAAWNQLRFQNLTVATTASGFQFDVQLYLGAIAPLDVAVQLYANGIDGAGPQVYDMTLQNAAALDGGSAAGLGLYRVAVPANRPAGDYTARVVPRLAGAAVPLESNHILWQR
jgi:starch phosphorylase